MKLSGLTTDEKDPRLTHGVDREPVQQAEAYLVLDQKELQKGFVRPVRDTYRHTVCGGETTMHRVIAEAYARQPKFYGSTYCVTCCKHLPVGEFNWRDGTTVGS